MAPTKGSQQFFVVLLPKYVVVSPPQFLVVRLLQFLACCRAGLLAVNNRRLRTIFGQSVDSRHWSRLIYGITSLSSSSYFCLKFTHRILKKKKERKILEFLDAIVSSSTVAPAPVGESVSVSGQGFPDFRLSFHISELYKIVCRQFHS